MSRQDGRGSDKGAGLLYQAQPIQRVNGNPPAPDGSPSDSDSAGLISPLGHELLYRGEGRYPDEALLKALGGATLAVDGLLHINLDGVRATSVSDELIEMASQHYQIVIEWVEGNNHISSRMTSLVGSRLDVWRRRFGVKVAIDDWDATSDGDARYHAVDNAPDIVKVGGPLFRRALAGDKEARALLENFMGLVREQGEDIVRVIEWVEHLEELAQAEEMGANAAQGFAFSGQEITIQSENKGSKGPGEK